jgi:endonuclease/exonuclease/phosphatase family metal-dependent hydrolase
VKLVQLNAWGGRLETQIEDFLKSIDPDILCLQESISLSAKGSGLFITTERIQDEFNLPFAALGPVFSFNYMHSTAKFGNGVLSRLPITESTVVFTSGERVDNFMWDDEIANMRNFVHAVVDIDGRLCHVITHHGYWIREHKNGNEETLKQMSQLASYIKKLSGPVILTGDFNLQPDSPSLKPLNELLINLSVKNKLATTRTALTYKTEVCDYIFVNKAVQVRDFYAHDKIISDHKALILLAKTAKYHSTSPISLVNSCLSSSVILPFRSRIIFFTFSATSPASPLIPRTQSNASLSSSPVVTTVLSALV